MRGGFVFNMVPWLRLLVRPAPGWVIVGADWRSQEIIIAAAINRSSTVAWISCRALCASFFR